MTTMSPAASANRKSSVVFLFLAGILLALLFLAIIFILSSSGLIPTLFRSPSTNTCTCNDVTPPRFNRRFDPPVSTFYDDPTFGYTLENPIKNWNKKRQQWLNLHPSFVFRSDVRILLVTGSESNPCQNPKGDHFRLRFYRNKIDYCRIHGYDIFYNNVLLDPRMKNGWAKLPAVRAAMVAHPEAEWIWWIDEDAVFTDMDFKVPLKLYKDRNFVVHGWPEDKNRVGLNAGSFLIRNCEWSIGFLEEWSDMGPQSINHEKWTEILSKTFQREADNPDYEHVYEVQPYKDPRILKDSPADDQTALAYLVMNETKNDQPSKVHIETEYYLEGNWMVIMDILKNITKKYNEIEKGSEILRRRHAELVSERYAELREPYLKDAGYGFGSLRRPFVTHFTGCRPCNGKPDPSFSRQRCWEAIDKVLSYADNQVLRNYGFTHPDLSDPSVVLPLPFHYPA